MRRRKYEKLPLVELMELRDELQIIITDIENGPRREIDIATDHKGDPDLIAQVLRIVGDKTNGKWIQVERIFCSKEKCPKCPHGDFHYEYRINKKKGITTVRFKGIGFNEEVLGNIRFFELKDEGNTLCILPEK